MQTSTGSNIDNAFQIQFRQGPVFGRRCLPCPTMRKFWPIPGICDTLRTMRCGPLTLALVMASRDRPPQPPPPPPPPPHDGVVLIQPGAPPLETLRYHLTKGSTTASELMYDVDVKNDGQGGAVPTLVVDLETTVQDVLGDGSAQLRIAVIGARVRERPGSQLSDELVRGQAAALRGVIITETLAPD